MLNDIFVFLSIFVILIFEYFYPARDYNIIY